MRPHVCGWTRWALARQRANPLCMLFPSKDATSSAWTARTARPSRGTCISPQLNTESKDLEIALWHTRPRVCCGSVASETSWPRMASTAHRAGIFLRREVRAAVGARQSVDHLAETQQINRLGPLRGGFLRCVDEGFRGLSGGRVRSDLRPLCPRHRSPR